MSAESHGPDLIHAVALLAAGVVAVPLFKRLGLGSVLGYLAAGLVIGPFGLGLFTDPQAILHVAELGVVMFLFIIGLEMQPSKLWNLRREIFGLGVLQVGVCALLLTVVGVYLLELSPIPAFVAGTGFVLTSTAIVMQLLEERGELTSPAGERVVSILLLEDLAIVPLIAIVAFLAPNSPETTVEQRWLSVGIAVAAVAAVIAAGRWLLNPFFRLLASAHAREVMTAAALLVVLGAALTMQMSGLSMAMGAFLAGVLLSESSFRHQLEADVEPFRGILLGLFFISVGMSLNLTVIAQNLGLIAMATLGYMIVKSIAIYGIARLMKSHHREALTRSVLMAQGGEFAFVLYTAATASGIFQPETNALMTATVIISMALTPLASIGLSKYLARLPQEEPNMDGVDEVAELSASVLVIGFGRFGQISSQPLLLRDVDVSIIDNDVEMIQAAAKFGFKVYYGDGRRLDILHAAGAGRAKAVYICVDDKESGKAIARLLKEHFPLAKVHARSYDRRHAIEMMQIGVDYQLRETFESALAFGGESLRSLGFTEDEVIETLEDVRVRDRERLAVQAVHGDRAGQGFFKGNMPMPTPFITPKKLGQALNQETAVALATQAKEDT